MDTFYLSSLTMLPFAPLSVVFKLYKWLKRNKETHTGDKYNPMRRSKDSLGKQNFFLLPLLPRWFFFLDPRTTFIFTFQQPADWVLIIREHFNKTHLTLTCITWRSHCLKFQRKHMNHLSVTILRSHRASL